MTVQRWSAIQSALVKAAHAGTGDVEAISSLRLANKLLENQNLSLVDLKVGQDSEPEKRTPLAMLRRIEELESNVNAYARNEKRLQATLSARDATITDLQAKLQAAQKPTPKPAPPSMERKGRDLPRAESQYAFREVIMELADSPRTQSSSEEVAARRAEKRDERIQRGKEDPTTAKPLKAGGRVKAPAADKTSTRYSWKMSLWEQAVQMYLAGKGKVEISKALVQEDGSGPSPASVFAATSNAKPPLWMSVKARDEGEAIDWKEAWLLGSHVFAEKRSWLGPTMEALKVNPPSKGLSFDISAHADAGAVETLRKQYRDGGFDKLRSEQNDKQRAADAAEFE